MCKSLDKDNLPTEEGVYLAKGGLWDYSEAQEIDVYEHPIKGLSCYSEDFGSGGTDVDDETDCHVSVQFGGLEFVTKVRDLD